MTHKMTTGTSARGHAATILKMKSSARAGSLAFKNDPISRTIQQEGKTTMISPKHLAGTTTAGSAAEVIVDVRGLVKNYSHKMVVKNVSFSIRRAEIFGVLGPNGAGKTTTLEMIEGIRKPDSGTVLVAGLDVFKHKCTVQP